MRKLTQREKIITGILISAVVIWFAFMMVQSYQQIRSDLKDQKENLIAKIQKQKQLIGQEGQIKETLDALRNFIGVASSDGVETASIVKLAEQAAAVHNVHLVNIQPQPSKVQGKLKAYHVELTLDGRWASITTFIQSMQASPNHLFIDSLQLEKYSESTGSLRGVLVLKRWRVL